MMIYFYVFACDVDCRYATARTVLQSECMQEWAALLVAPAKLVSSSNHVFLLDVLSYRLNAALNVK